MADIKTIQKEFETKLKEIRPDNYDFQKENIPKVAAAFTWPWLIENIAIGMAQGAGAQFLNRILGSGGPSLSNLAEHIITGVEIVIQREIVAESFRQTQDLLDSVENLYRTGLIMNDSFYAKNVVLDSNRLMSSFKRHHLNGFSGYLTSTTYKLAGLQLHGILDGINTIPAMQETIKNAKNHLDGMIWYWWHILLDPNNERKIIMVQTETLQRCHMSESDLHPRNICVPYDVYHVIDTRNGHRYGTHPHIDPAQAQANTLNQDQYNKAAEALIKPAEKVIQIWVDYIRRNGGEI